MPSETEALALHLVRAVYNATDGRPMQWRSLEGLDVPETASTARPLSALSSAIAIDRKQPEPNRDTFPSQSRHWWRERVELKERRSPTLSWRIYFDGFDMTRHALIAVLFCMLFSSFVLAILADGLANKGARPKGDK